MTGRAALIAVMLGASLAGTSSVVGAQTRGWNGRVYVNLNGGYQGTSSTFGNTVTFVSNLETAHFDSNYGVKRAPQFDLAGGVRVWRNLGVGVGVARMKASQPAIIAGEIPHPFFFNRARALDGQSGALTRQETSVHFQALWTIPLSTRFQIGVFGGPSLMKVRQDLVSAVTFSEAYPYDSVTFTGTTTDRQSRSKLGVNVGADLTYLFTRHVGVGGLLRFSRATVGFSAADGTAFTVRAGGTEVGAGLRLRF